MRSRYQVPQIDVIDVESRHAKRNPSSEVRTPSTVAFGERVEDIHDGFQYARHAVTCPVHPSWDQGLALRR